MEFSRNARELQPYWIISSACICYFQSENNFYDCKNKPNIFSYFSLSCTSLEEAWWTWRKSWWSSPSIVLLACSISPVRIFSFPICSITTWVRRECKVNSKPACVMSHEFSILLSMHSAVHFDGQKTNELNNTRFTVKVPVTLDLHNSYLNKALVSSRKVNVNFPIGTGGNRRGYVSQLRQSLSILIVMLLWYGNKDYLCMGKYYKQ